MTQIGPFTVSALPEAGLIGLEIALDNGSVVAAALSAGEVAALEVLLERIRGRLEREESPRVDVRAELAALIGRDPFDGQV